MNDKDKYLLSIYEEISVVSLSDSESKSRVSLVKSSIDDKVYIKKIIKNGDYNLFVRLKELSKMDVRLSEIVQVICDDDNIITIEKYYNCSSLENLISKMDRDSFLFVIKQILGALQTLYENAPAIIHRDIKPANILVDEDFKEIHLIDFGGARIYSRDAKRDTILLGTEQFAAPEQYGFSQSDARTDIYGLGATMRYILENGNIEFDNSEEKIHIEEIIAKATSMEPDNRYQTPSEMLDNLETTKTTEAIKTTADGGYRKFLPPGFRSGKFFNMLAALLMYYLLFFVTFNMESRSDDNIIITKIVVGIVFLFEVLVLANYCGIKDRIKFVQRDKSYKKISSSIGIGVLIFCAGVLLDCILQVVF